MRSAEERQMFERNVAETAVNQGLVEDERIAREAIRIGRRGAMWRKAFEARDVSRGLDVVETYLHEARKNFWREQERLDEEKLREEEERYYRERFVEVEPDEDVVVAETDEPLVIEE
ncbi:MAG: hypothetical protein NZ518_05355 [Dehalococcoidia bacterium]|nr:hypothetical protein [Dehalococcoidia bacterium]